MTIEYIDKRLKAWAEWSVRGGLVTGLWYARCNFAADAVDGRRPVDVAFDEEAEQIHRAIVALRPEFLRVAIHAFYLGRGSAEQRARDIGVSRRTLYQRVEHGQQRLASILEEMERAERDKHGAWKTRCSFAG